MIRLNEIKLNGSPSKQIEEITNWWKHAGALAATNPTLDVLRDVNENWQVLTKEPGDVDFLEIDANGVKAMWVIPHHSSEDHVILCLHGGGFIGGSIYTHRKMYSHLAKNIKCRALIIDYSLAPENNYPTQVNEAVAAYKWLLGQGIDAKNIALTGDSAGGGLAASTLLVIRDQGLPKPAAAMLMSAWLDMAGEGATMTTNSGKDVIFNIEWIKSMGQMYLGEKGDVTDPGASPVYANLSGLPPVYLHVGGDELLLDDSLRFAHSAGIAGVEVKVDVYEGMQHTFQMAAGRAPESDDSLARLAEWAKPKLGLK